jgi:hypothetical protein
MALTAVNPDEKKDLLEVEQGWLSLARKADPPGPPPSDFKSSIPKGAGHELVMFGCRENEGKEGCGT